MTTAKAALLSLSLLATAASSSLLPSPAQAFGWSDLDPFNKNGVAGGVVDRVIAAPSQLDPFNNNSAVSRLGRQLDPFYDGAMGRTLSRFDITDPRRPISKLCAPIIQGGGTAVGAYYGNPQAGMAAGNVGSGICPSGQTPGPAMASPSMGGYPAYDMGMGTGIGPGAMVMPMPAGPQYSLGNPYAPAPYQPRY